MTKSRKGRYIERNIKAKFESVLKKYEEILVEEQALKEITTGLTFSKKPTTMFKHLNYEDIKTHGISRQVGGKYKRYKGFEAVEIQIKSLEKRVNKDAQKAHYIENVDKALINEGYNIEDRKRVTKKLNQLTAQELSIAINLNALPSIYRIYGETKEERKQTIINEFDDSVEAIQNSDITTKAGQKMYALKQNIVERWKILG